MLKNLVFNTRTCRRFQEDQPVALETLLTLIDLARLAGSAKNIQPLKYMAINDARRNGLIFPYLGWAGYLPDWPGPVPGERPAAYIVCLLDTSLSSRAEFDLGIASQNILLGATEVGLSGCRIASIAAGLHSTLQLPSHLHIQLVIALGRPKEKVLIEVMPHDGSCRYWHDGDQIHHVPKRSLKEIIVDPVF